MISDERKTQILEWIAKIPICQSLRMRVETLDKGFCRAVVPLDPTLIGAHGSYHGGLLATAADSVACFAILTQTGIEQAMTTTDFTVRFLAPCYTDATVEARVLKVGRTLSPVTVDLFDASGTHVAAAQVTYFLYDRPSGQP